MLLAMDTSTQWMGLALYDGAQVLAETTWHTRNHHTVELAPAVAGLLKQCSIQPGDLTAVAVALGPGSFTSLRIGLAMAKGLGLANRMPVVGIATLDILAAAVPPAAEPLVIVLQAGRGRLAAGWYACVEGKWTPQGAAEALRVDDLNHRILEPTLVYGELSAEERQVLARRRKNVILASPANSVRRPAVLAEMAWERLQAGKTDDVASLAPIYLHTAEAIPE